VSSEAFSSSVSWARTPASWDTAYTTA